MALKRKLDLDSSEDFPQVCVSPYLLSPPYIFTACQTVKQLKLVPFPGYQPDHDVAMSDSSSSDSEQFFPENHHTRLVSTASTSSSSFGSSEAVDYNSRECLRFPSRPCLMGEFIPLSALYPRYSAHQPTFDPSESPKVVGLMQPASTLSHHGYVNYTTYYRSDLTASWLVHFAH